MDNFIIYHLYIALCAHHPKSSVLQSPYTMTLLFFKKSIFVIYNFIEAVY